MLQQAHYLVLVQNYSEALKAYDTHLKETPSDYEALIGRSIVYHALGNWDQSVNDAESAILIDRKRYDGFFRRGIANLSQGRLQAALIDFEDASLKVSGQPKLYIETEIRKARAEIENKQFKEIQAKPIQQSAQQQETKPHQQMQTQPIRENKFAPQPVANPEAKRSDVQNPSGKINYKWYQTDSKVGIEIQQTLANQNLLKTKFGEKHVEVSFPLQNGNTFELIIDLQWEIVPDQSKSRVSQNQIEILLQKKIQNHNWTRLEVEDSNDAQPPVPQQAYPSSAKIKKDWSKIDKEIEQDIEKNKEAYGEDPLNGLFKMIYQNGTEETRKAMVKSMQTSGGTVLSTNWDEVKSKDYEGKDRPSPPKGQERKALDK